jgi:hypothetical protein
MLTRPKGVRLTHNQSDMLWTLLHLTGQIYRRRHDQIRICLSQLDLGVEAPDVDLGGGDGLLAHAHLAAQFRYLCAGQRSRSAVACLGNSRSLM